MMTHLLLFIPCLLTRGGDAPRPGSAALNTRVNEAIEKGKEELLRRMDVLIKSTASDFPVGRLAFPLTALLKSGVLEDDPRMREGLAKLETLKVEKTYCAACYLFLLDAILASRRRETPERPRGKTASLPRGTEDPLIARIRELADWLLAAQAPGQGGWSYGTPPRKEAHDFSNTQFAALGLQVALKHGVPVPPRAFADLAALLEGSMTLEGAGEAASIDVEQPLEMKLRLTRVSPQRKFRAAPGGWGYTDPRKGKADRDKPYASMTAAGASSLVIAINALRSARVPADAATQKLILQGEPALQSAYAWISKRFGEFTGEGRELYYTLYSLEKAGDLCKVERFGDHDWYAEGAAKLLEKQRPNGGWGTYVDTSLALLFLTRATKAFEAVAPPRILTGEANKGAARPRDLVFIERASGFLSASALLKYIGATRRAELVPVGEEVVQHYAPDWRDELVPQLLELWRESDRVTAFAQKALAEITGVETRERQAIVDWEEERGRVLELESREKIEPSALSALIREVRAPRLRGRLAGLAQRMDLRQLAGVLVAELDLPSIEYRKRLHGILSLWTGAPIQAPPRDTAPAWESTAREWRDWWTLHAAGWEARYGRAP